MGHHSSTYHAAQSGSYFFLAKIDSQRTAQHSLVSPSSHHFPVGPPTSPLFPPIFPHPPHHPSSPPVPPISHGALRVNPAGHFRGLIRYFEAQLNRWSPMLIDGSFVDSAEVVEAGTCSAQP